VTPHIGSAVATYGRHSNAGALELVPCWADSIILYNARENRLP